MLFVFLFFMLFRFLNMLGCCMRLESLIVFLLLVGSSFGLYLENLLLMLDVCCIFLFVVSLFLGGMVFIFIVDFVCSGSLIGFNMFMYGIFFFCVLFLSLLSLCLKVTGLVEVVVFGICTILLFVVFGSCKKGY